MLLYLFTAWGTTFTDVSTGSGALGDGTAGSGIAVADFDGDGLRDILALSGRSTGSGPQLLIQSSPFIYANHTQTLAPAMLGRRPARIAVAADLDNDGLRDVLLSDSDWVSIFFQRTDGTYGPPEDAAAANADLEFISEDVTPLQGILVPGLNPEGLVLFDADADQLLDVQIGWRFSRIGNPGLPGATLEIGADGLPDIQLDDDFIAADDIDRDGWIDIAVGRDGSMGGEPDIFFGGPAGWSPHAGLQFDAYDSKGAVLMCDFDGDLDLDLFRTVRPFPNLPPLPNTANQIWTYEGTAGFLSTGNPGVDTTHGTWAAACGDIDNDLDIDLVVMDESPQIYILRNTPLGWVQDNGGVVSGTLKGIALADLDLDGDLDLFLNQQGNNQIWRNDLDDQRFLSIEILANVGTCEAPVLRDDFHASFTIHDWTTGLDTPLHTVKEASGTGTSVAQPVHVGLGDFEPTGYYDLRLQTLAIAADGSPIPPGNRTVSIGSDPAHHIVIRSDDIDNDGMPVDVEGTGDFDADGRGNYTDWDSDGDGFSDGAEAGSDPCSPVDTDNDGEPDFLDIDADGDGATDDIDCDRLDAMVGGPVAWYSDSDGDGIGDALVATQCAAPSGTSSLGGDCDDSEATVYPGAPEDCDPVDRDCDGDPDAGAHDELEGFLDADGDGHGDPLVSLMACTLPAAYLDLGDDCDDTEPAAHPGAAEICDSIDNDCDGTVDGSGASDAVAFFLDGDNDGFGAGVPVLSCVQPVFHQPDGSDCDDTAATIFPGAPEQCNDIDDDCDLTVDEGVVAVLWYLDADGDGFGVADTLTDCQQPVGYALNPGDCNDADAGVNPNVVEICNGFDDNCGLGEDDAVDAPIYFVDADGDGWGAIGSGAPSCEPDVDASVVAGDCDDTDPLTSPSEPEFCDGVDNDCNTLIDDQAFDLVLGWEDLDGDGWGDPNATAAFCVLPAGWADNDLDCNDQEPLAWSGALETCDGADNDCDGLLDQADPDVPPNTTNPWYPDLDGDGFGGADVMEVCTPPLDHVELPGDCDDTSSTVNPDALEIPDNGIDEDCDGSDLVLNPDRDGDGLPDALEASGDFDGDGLDNIDDPDSDDDGVVDGAERSPEAVLSSGDLTTTGVPSPSYGCQTARVSGSVIGLFARR